MKEVSKDKDLDLDLELIAELQNVYMNDSVMSTLWATGCLGFLQRIWDTLSFGLLNKGCKLLSRVIEQAVKALAAEGFHTAVTSRLTQRVRHFVQGVLSLLKPLAAKKNARKHKQFILQFMQTLLSQEALEKPSSPEVLMDFVTPALELLKHTEDEDIVNSILNESKHLLTEVFRQIFSIQDIERFSKLVQEYLNTADLDLGERKRLFKFKSFVQQLSAQVKRLLAGKPPIEQDCDSEVNEFDDDEEDDDGEPDEAEVDDDIHHIFADEDQQVRAEAMAEESAAKYTNTSIISFKRTNTKQRSNKAPKPRKQPHESGNQNPAAKLSPKKSPLKGSGDEYLVINAGQANENLNQGMQRQRRNHERTFDHLDALKRIEMLEDSRANTKSAKPTKPHTHPPPPDRDPGHGSYSDEILQQAVGASQPVRPIKVNLNRLKKKSHDAVGRKWVKRATELQESGGSYENVFSLSNLMTVDDEVERVVPRPMTPYAHRHNSEAARTADSQPSYRIKTAVHKDRDPKALKKQANNKVKANKAQKAYIKSISSQPQLLIESADHEGERDADEEVESNTKTKNKNRASPRKVADSLIASIDIQDKRSPLKSSLAKPTPFTLQYSASSDAPQQASPRRAKTPPRFSSNVQDEIVNEFVLSNLSPLHDLVEGSSQRIMSSGKKAPLKYVTSKTGARGSAEKHLDDVDTANISATKKRSPSKKMNLEDMTSLGDEYGDLHARRTLQLIEDKTPVKIASPKKGGTSPSKQLVALFNEASLQEYGDDALELPQRGA